MVSCQANFTDVSDFVRAPALNLFGHLSPFVIFFIFFEIILPKKSSYIYERLKKTKKGEVYHKGVKNKKEVCYAKRAKVNCGWGPLPYHGKGKPETNGI